MNGLIAFLLVLAALGLLDQLLGGRMGLAEPFGRGVDSMGRLAISLVVRKSRATTPKKAHFLPSHLLARALGEGTSQDKA